METTGILQEYKEKTGRPKFKIGQKVATRFGSEFVTGGAKGVITQLFQGWHDYYYYELNNSGTYYPEKVLEKYEEYQKRISKC